VRRRHRRGRLRSGWAAWCWICRCGMPCVLGLALPGRGCLRVNGLCVGAALSPSFPNFLLLSFHPSTPLLTPSLPDYSNRAKRPGSRSYTSCRIFLSLFTFGDFMYDIYTLVPFFTRRHFELLDLEGRSTPWRWCTAYEGHTQAAMVRRLESSES
jgi:hypothetical protein